VVFYFNIAEILLPTLFDKYETNLLRQPNKNE